MADQVSVDVGSGFTKYTNGKTEGAYPSLVCLMPTVRLFGAENAETVEMENVLYVVGDDARAFGIADSKANTLRDDWAGSPPWMALLYAALVRLGVGSTIDLVVGLPLALFDNKKDALVHSLQRRHHFKVRGKNYEIDINPTVVPQAVGALFYKAWKDPRLLDDTFGVIDPGTYTTGYALLDHHRLIRNKSDGCAIGVSQVGAAVVQYIQVACGFTPDTANLHHILKNRSVRRRGEEIDVGDAIDTAVLTVAKPMLDRIHQLWSGGNEHLIFIAGGGAHVFLKAIQTILPHATPLPENEAFFAVARGMHQYLIGQA